jgi:hypothetical protein
MPRERVHPYWPPNRPPCGVCGLALGLFRDRRTALEFLHHEASQLDFNGWPFRSMAEEERRGRAKVSSRHLSTRWPASTLHAIYNVLRQKSVLGRFDVGLAVAVQNVSLLASLERVQTLARAPFPSLFNSLQTELKCLPSPCLRYVYM